MHRSTTDGLHSWICSPDIRWGYQNTQGQDLSASRDRCFVTDGGADKERWRYRDEINIGYPYCCTFILMFYKHNEGIICTTDSTIWTVSDMPCFYRRWCWCQLSNQIQSDLLLLRGWQQGSDMPVLVVGTIKPQSWEGTYVVSHED